MSSVRVFAYVEELDAFLVTSEFQALSERLGLTEWNEVVWIGRLFMLDNDYGERWFDNWDEREVLEERAAKLGIDSYDLMVINSERLANKEDGACHSSDIRKRFWTDVLRSLELSYELIFEEARNSNAWNKQNWPDGYIADLEQRIAEIQQP